jgi:uncharacterized integral membrane protein
MKAEIGREKSDDVAGRVQHKDTSGDWGGLKAYALLFLLIILSGLVVRNSQLVQMDFVVSQGLTDLMWVMLGCAALGATIGYLLATLNLARDNQMRMRDPSEDLSRTSERSPATEHGNRDSSHR